MNEEANNPNPTGIVVSYKMKSILRSTARWILILCVIYCIHEFYYTIDTLARINHEISFAEGRGDFGKRMMYFNNTMNIVWMFTSIIKIYVIILGFQFYNKARLALLTDNEGQLNIAFGKLKSFFLWSAINVIIVLITTLIYRFGTLYMLSQPS